MTTKPTHTSGPITNGGGAFPFHCLKRGTWDGMTLRDYFAAKAMQAEVSREGLEGSDVLFTAQMAYEQADAMLAARGKGDAS